MSPATPKYNIHMKLFSTHNALTITAMVAVCTFGLNDTNITHAQTLRVHQPGELPFTNDTPSERPGLGLILVPHPNSVLPNEVIDNVKKIIASAMLDKVASLPELIGELRAGRILQVRADQPAPGYLVVELEDMAGNAIANMAMTRAGEFMALESARGGGRGKSLALDEATSRARNHISKSLGNPEYVYFTNIAEPGISIFRPLVAIRTDDGYLYMNSRGEAFAEESSALAIMFNGRAPQGAQQHKDSDLLPLRYIGRW
jgi:hypothetical protein